MEDNILYKGIDEVYVIKDILVGLNQEKKEKETLDLEEKKLEKVIKLREKTMEDEINVTVKSRKEAILATYDGQLSAVKNKIKKIKNKKEKIKTEEISKRIAEETKDLKSLNKDTKRQIKQIIKENKMPKITGASMFYSLYMPKGFIDFFNIILAIFFTLVLLPFTLYYFTIKNENLLLLLIIYAVFVVVFAAIYMLIENKIKDKYIDKLKIIRELKLNIRNNKKEQAKVTNIIQKNKDESIYPIDDLNNEIIQLEKEQKKIEDEKIQASNTFDEKTKNEIIVEIKHQYSRELHDMKNQLDKKKALNRSLQEKIKSTALYLANTYEVYIGREWVTEEKLDNIAEVMKQHNLKTISDGIQYLKTI